MDDKTVLVFIDFGANFTYVIQNEVQSGYWSRESCTLHPVSVYYKNNEEITNKSKLCIYGNLGTL